MARLFFSLLLLGVFFPVFVLSQDDEEKKDGCAKSENKKALKLYKQAMETGGEERRKLLRQVIEEDPDFIDAYWSIAKSNFNQGFIQGVTVDYLHKVIQLCPTYNVYAYYYLADIYFGDNKFSEAEKYLKEFLKDADKIKKDEDYKRAERMLSQAKYFATLYGNPVPFNPKIVTGISTPNDEVLPIISPDNELAFFTRRFPEPMKTAWESSEKRVIEKFMMSQRISGLEFNEGEPMGPPFNMNNNEGGATISVDNKHLFFTICKPNMKGYNNCDIYYSDFVDGKWTDIKPLSDAVNGKDTWEVQPSLAGDGKTLYFVSVRPGNIGYGETADKQTSDIWKTVRKPDGTWSAPENLGPAINTDGNEKSPFIHSDSQTLYFASDGHLGIGGYDIFFAKTDSTDRWMKPKNIGYPINTEADELSLFVSADGRTAFFASNNLKGAGGWDLYSFDLHVAARPEKIALIKGQLKNREGQPVTGAKVELKNAATKEVTQVEVDSTDGRYAVVVKMKKDDNYLLTIKNPEQAFEAHLISARDSLMPVVQKFEEPVKPVIAGETYKLNNINYKTNLAELTEESKIMLDEFAGYLRTHPTMRIGIQGHTDNVGDEASNLALSTDRAFTVYDYLMQKGGIDKSRLTFQGFGKNKPIASNDTEEGRAKNRRTEFVVLSK